MAGLVDYGDSDEETTEPVAAPAVAVAPASKAAPKQGLGLPQAEKSGGLDFLNSGDDDPLMAGPKSSLSLLLGSLPTPKSTSAGKTLTKKQAELLEKRKKLFSMPTLDDVRKTLSLLKTPTIDSTIYIFFTFTKLQIPSDEDEAPAKKNPFLANAVSSTSRLLASPKGERRVFRRKHYQYSSKSQACPPD